jgi:hypothetical protein
MACVIQGGDEPPCLPESLLREIDAEHGRPCPRVQLAPQNGVAAELVSFLLDERLRPLAAELVRGRTRWMQSDERTLLILRLARALQDKHVAQALYPELAKAKG